MRGTEIHTFSGDAIQLDPTRSAPGWGQITIERCRLWLAPLTAAENGFPAGTVPGENALDTKTFAGARGKVVIKDTVAWGFRGGLIGNMAAFNLKENIDATLDGVTVYGSEIAFRCRAPALIAIKNAVVRDSDKGVRYEDNITGLRVANMTVGMGVTEPFEAASAVPAGVDVKNLLLLGAALPVEAAGPTSLAVSAAAFVDAAAADYHLAAGSPAIDRGMPIADVLTDREGTPRPQGGQYDAGAYERK